MNLKNNDTQNFLWRLVLNISILSGILYLGVDLLNNRPLSSLPLVTLLIIFRVFYSKWIHSTRLKNGIKAFTMFVIYPVSYFLSVGMKGPFAYSLFMAIIVLVLVSESKIEFLFPLGVIAMGGIFIGFEYLYPNYFNDVYQELYKNVAFASNFILTSIAVFIIASAAQIYIMESQKKLYNLSVSDELTGVFNRRFLIESLKKVADYSKRMNRDFVLIFIDINKFKQINDTQGHLVGDQILIYLGKILQDNARSYDICGRYGGDEFIVILPDTSIEQAKTICKRYSELFVSLTANELKLNTPVSLALGLCEGKGKSVDQIIHEADEKMYQHKVSSR